MRVTCSSCSANYTIADDKVRNRHVKLRCKRCGATIVVDGTTVGGSSGAAAATSGRESEALSLQPEPPPAESDLWTVNLTDEDEREMTTSQVVAGYLDGTVTDDAFVWKEGMGDWVAVMAVPELKSGIEAARAKPKSWRAAAAPRATGAGQSASKGSTAAARLDSPEGPKSSRPSSSKATASVPRASGAAAHKAEAKIGATVGSNQSEPGAPKADGAKGAASLPSAQRQTAARVGAKPSGATASTVGGQKAPAAKHSTVADLFSAAAKAGSEEEVEVVLSPAAEPAAVARPSSAAARNESSVLFSLDALKAGFAAAGTVPKQPTTQPKKTSLDAIMSMPSPTGVLGFGTADLLTAPAPPPPPPPPKPKVVEPEVKAVAADFPPPAPPASGKRKLLIAAIAMIGLIGAGGLVMAALGDNKEEQQRVAEQEARLKKLEEEKLAAEKAAKLAEKEAAAAKEAAEEAARRASTSTDTPSSANKAEESEDNDGGAKVASSSRWSGSGVAAKNPKDDEKKDGKPAAPAPPKKEGASVTVSSTPSSGVSTFNKGAARSALSVAASGAAGCKKANGPTGSGRVMVTFAPSGRVTSANVVGPPFAGTSVGGCVATIFRRATVPAFSGDSVTVAKGFSIQ